MTSSTITQEMGSSGSPVLATASHEIIALHHCADCPNRGVPIHLIYPEIAEYLPGPAGTIALDRDTYHCQDEIGILVRDSDLADTGSLFVVVTSSGGDSETVSLTETWPGSTVLAGSVPTGSGSIAPDDGTLQIVHADTITATYDDADDGTGNPATVWDTAIADCGPRADFDLDGDVDMADFGHLQRCFSGPDVPQGEPSCLDARLDGDPDVDQDDFAIFQRCLTGPNVPADPFCADD